MSDKIMEFPRGKKTPSSRAAERPAAGPQTPKLAAPATSLRLELPPVIQEHLNAAGARMRSSPQRAAETFVIWGLAQFEGKSLLEFTKSLDPVAPTEGLGAANVVCLTALLASPTREENG